MSSKEITSNSDFQTGCQCRPVLVAWCKIIALICLLVGFKNEMSIEQLILLYIACILDCRQTKTRPGFWEVPRRGSVRNSGDKKTCYKAKLLYGSVVVRYDVLSCWKLSL